MDLTQTAAAETALTEKAFTQSDAQAICLWRYDPPYDAYNCPDWQTVTRLGWAMADASRRQSQFRALWLKGALAGYYRLAPGDGHVTLGLGLRPDLCGKGLGKQAVALALSAAKARCGGLPVYLAVRDFNARAIACYRRAGFAPIGRSEKSAPEGTAVFLLMAYREK